MANIYVRSTDGSNADNGSTWALAKLDLVGAAAIDAAGDNIYVSDNHAESTAAAITIALAGSNASPVKIICGDDSAEPPTAAATTGTVTTTGNSNITFNGTNYYVYGLRFNVGTGAVNATIAPVNTTSAQATFDSCTFDCVATGSGTGVSVSAGELYLVNSWVKFANAGGTIAVNIANNTRFEWHGGGLESGTTSPTQLVEVASSDGRLSGLDLSAGGSGMHIFQFSGGPARYSIRNSKLPASWSGSLVTGTLVAGCRFEMYNCDSTDTNYRLLISDYAGTVSQETTIVRTGGASDGTTTISHKFVTTANAEYPHIPLAGPEIVIWNDTTGSSKTVTVEIVTDNVTLTDGECWLEVQYLGTSGFPLGSIASDAKADVLATAANQATSTETWTTTGLTTPVKQKLVVTFTPQEVGFVHAVVKLAKASTTVYVCPKLTLA